jgi:GNAT superfamily N-acetyltransferase
MEISARPARQPEVEPLRELYRHAMGCQIIMDSFLRRGFSDGYLLLADGRPAGYGLVARQYYPGRVHELYLFPRYRPAAATFLRTLLAAAAATGIRAQSNDPLLSLLLWDCAEEVSSDVILFADGTTTQLPCPGVTLRPVQPADHEPLRRLDLAAEGGWLLERDGEPVASGGFLCHYNPPYGDVYMQVHAAHRRRGYGSYLVQELKRLCYEHGKQPAARCNADNVASRATLQKAGFRLCGRVLEGRVSP